MALLKETGKSFFFSGSMLLHQIYLYDHLEGQVVFRILGQVGVPIMAQWLTNPTRNHEVTGSIPGLA